MLLAWNGCCVLFLEVRGNLSPGGPGEACYPDRRRYRGQRE